MKKIILHGDNTLKSYNRLQYLISVAKSRSWEIIRKNDNQILVDLLRSRSLFPKDRLILVEDIKLLNKDEIEFLNNYSDERATFILYSDDFINISLLKSLKEVYKIESFELPKIIWTFLDLIRPGKAYICINMMHDLVKYEPIELIFQLIVQRIRDLYWIMEDDKSIFIEKWKIGKLKNQISQFTKYRLRNMIINLSEIDIKSKTGNGELITMLDFMFIKHLK